MAEKDVKYVTPEPFKKTGSMKLHAFPCYRYSTGTDQRTSSRLASWHLVEVLYLFDFLNANAVIKSLLTSLTCGDFTQGSAGFKIPRIEEFVPGDHEQFILKHPWYLVTGKHACPSLQMPADTD